MENELTFLSDPVVRHGSFIETSVWADQATDIYSVSTLRLKNEQQENVNSSIYYCNFCRFVTIYKQTMMQHIYEHTFRCSVCEFDAFSRASVLLHFKKRHPRLLTFQQLFFCWLTSETFACKRKSNDDSMSDDDMEDLEIVLENLDPVDEEASYSQSKTACQNSKPKSNISRNSSGNKIKGNPKVVLERLPEEVLKKFKASANPTFVGSEFLMESLNQDLKKDIDSGKDKVSSKDENLNKMQDKKHLEPSQFAKTVFDKQSEQSSSQDLREPGLLSIPRVSDQETKVNTNSEISQFPNSSFDTDSDMEDTSKVDSLIEIPASKDNLFLVTSDIDEGSQGSEGSIENHNDELSKAGKKTMERQSTNPCKPKNPAPYATVTKIHWKCSFCSFTSVHQEDVSLHISNTHPDKLPKFVGVIDDKAGTDISPQDQNVSPSKKLQTESSIVLPQDPNDLETVKKDEKKSNDSTNFQCLHCRFNCFGISVLKQHMLHLHRGLVLYGVDMDAVDSPKNPYVLFCLNESCSFETKDGVIFLAHTDSCINVDIPEEVERTWIQKSLEEIKDFIPKMSLLADSKDLDNVIYRCHYCSFSNTSNMSAVKRHLVLQHKEQPLKIQVVYPGSGAIPPYLVHSCPYCLWDYRLEASLIEHIKEKHPMKKLHSYNIQETIEHTTRTTRKCPSVAPGSILGHKDGQWESKVTEGSKHMLAHLLAKKGKAVNPHLVAGQSSPGDSLNTSDVMNDDRSTTKVINKQVLVKGMMPRHLTFRMFEPYVRKDELLQQAVDFMLAECSFKWSRELFTVLGLSGLDTLLLKDRLNPRLLKCHHCSQLVFGVSLMKQHILLNHSLITSWQITDVAKVILEMPDTMLTLCRNKLCEFSAYNSKEVLEHEKEPHNNVNQPLRQKSVNPTTPYSSSPWHESTKFRSPENANSARPSTCKPAVNPRWAQQPPTLMKQLAGGSGASHTATSAVKQENMENSPGVQVIVNDGEVTVKVEMNELEESASSRGSPPVVRSDTLVTNTQQVPSSFVRPGTSVTKALQEHQGSNNSSGKKLRKNTVPVEFQCLYCFGKVTFSSLVGINKHLIMFHSEKDFVFQENVAKMLKMPSTVYMCKNLGCSFMSVDIDVFNSHNKSHLPLQKNK